jgi:hypothetical protein
MRVLSPSFLALPQAFAEIMRPLYEDYPIFCAKAGRVVNNNLIAPIAAGFDALKADDANYEAEVR